MLFLGPHIIKVVLTANECESVHFDTTTQWLSWNDSGFEILSYPKFAFQVRTLSILLLLVLTTSQTSHYSLHLSTRHLSNYLLGCWQCIRWDASLLPRPSRQTQWWKHWRTPRTGIQQSSNVLRSKSEIICDSKCQTHRFLCYLLSCSHSQSSIWFGRSRMWLFGHPIQDFFVCNSNSQRVCESSYSSLLLHSLFQFFYSWLLHVNHSFLFASFGTLYFHCIESDQQASYKSMHRE